MCARPGLPKPRGRPAGLEAPPAVCSGHTGPPTASTLSSEDQAGPAHKAVPGASRPSPSLAEPIRVSSRTSRSVRRRGDGEGAPGPAAWGSWVKSQSKRALEERGSRAANWGGEDRKANPSERQTRGNPREGPQHHSPSQSSVLLIAFALWSLRQPGCSCSPGGRRCTLTSAFSP